MRWYKKKFWRFAISYNTGTRVDGWVAVFGTKLYVNTSPISFSWKI
jgi:hypothetical protein